MKIRTIKIGNRDLATITQEELLQVVMIEGCCADLDYWNIPEIIRFRNKLFSSTVVLEYYSKRKRDNIKSCVVVFFFDHKNFSFYYRTEAIERRNKRISIDTIKYLLKEGFNLPIY